VHLYPALDLRAGRLARAAAAPDAVLDRWRAAGATWVHVTDMDRAFGTGDNTSLVRTLLATDPPAVQLGGGLVGADVAAALAWGARRVVVGARGTDDLPALVDAHGRERIALALDVRAGWVCTPGGEPVGEPAALLDHARRARVRTIVYRDLERDGGLRGAALDGAAAACHRDFEVVVAGGIASLDDLRRARDLGLAGVIVGRALLEGRFTIEEALACCG